MNKLSLSKQSQLLTGQPMFKLMDRANQLEKEGKDIIHFEIGETDLNTPFKIKFDTCKSIMKNNTHYVSSNGNINLRKKIKEHYNYLDIDIDNILITPSANIIIYYALLTTCNKGDEIILPDPCFPSYYSIINYLELKAIPLKLSYKDNFRVNPNEFKKLITNKTKMIILNSPSNPTGSNIYKLDYDEINFIAKSRNIYVYNDVIYKDIIYDNYNYSLNFNNNSIIADGFSKFFSMTGFRLGYVIANKDIINSISLLLQSTSSCVSPFIQDAGLSALYLGNNYKQKIIKHYKKRMLYMKSKLEIIDNIICNESNGAIYLFPYIGNTGLTSKQFSDRLLNEYGVAVLPGTDFGKYGEGYIRLCFATSFKNIEEGCKRIKLFVDSL